VGTQDRAIYKSMRVTVAFGAVIVLRMIGVLVFVTVRVQRVIVRVLACVLAEDGSVGCPKMAHGRTLATC
jgi:hypothetical protein